MNPSLFELHPPVTAPYQQGSATSKAAADRAKTFIGKQGEQVYQWFVEQDAIGGTQREAADALGLGRQSVAPRVNALWRAGRLVKLLTRRDGCAIYRVVR